LRNGRTFTILLMVVELFTYIKDNAMAREQWLNALAKELGALFDANGYEIPSNVRMSCGFPSKGATALRNRRIGECWTSKCSEDGTFEIFISPTLSDDMRVAGILAHELVHAVVGLAAGHKTPFKRCAVAIGLEGKMTATTESEAFKQSVQPMLNKLGPYPHATLDASSSPKKQTTRLKKVICQACDYTARVTSKWLDESGAPLCPCNHEPMEVS